MKFNKNTALFALVLVFLAGPMVASAQSIVPTVCVNITAYLRYGSTDFYTGGAGTELQQFFAGQGYFYSAYLGTGRFGPLTARAVMQYQVARGITPVGVVGPLTRAAIYNHTCGGTVVPPVSGTPAINSLSPASGPIGTRLTVAGYNFTADNTVLMDGMVIAAGVPAQPTGIVCIAYPCGGSQSITITVPEYASPYCGPGMYCIMLARQITPGPHQIAVQNQNGTSNTQTFTVMPIY